MSQRASFLVMALFVAPVCLPAQGAPWTVSAKPTLLLGDASGDANVLFGDGLVGATRFPDGRLLVADRADFSLKLFDASGKFLKHAGRKGAGPGEMTYLARLFRCGDQVMTYDIEGYRMTVFDPSLELVRSFRFKAPSSATPYASACNASGTFVHYGWTDRKDMKGGIHRGDVDLWTSGPDSVIRRIIGRIPGSERWGQVVGGQLRGSRPVPLGKEPVIGISADRIFVGSADTYEIAVHDLAGNRVGTIRKPNVNLATTKADIDFALEREQAGRSQHEQKRIADGYAAMQFPKTIPAYKKLVVDADGLIWVQDYPRAKSPTSRWTVFSAAGVQQAEVLLPTHLEVYEIGKDYVLGKYLDPDEQIPEIRMYSLRRGSGR